jgi:GNAT superfamily N-acetyltransferase
MIRLDRLTVADGPRLRSIRLDALRDSPDAFGTTFDQAASWEPEERWAAQLRALATIVAVNDGIDVGMVRCALDETSPDTAWLVSMWVAPYSRQQGIGGHLVDAVAGWARSHGAVRLRLDVADGNRSATALYVSKGFKPTGHTSAFPPPREFI